MFISLKLKNGTLKVELRCFITSETSLIFRVPPLINKPTVHLCIKALSRALRNRVSNFYFSIFSSIAIYSKRMAASK